MGYINKDYILNIENEIGKMADLDEIKYRIVDVCQCATVLNGEDLRQISQNVKTHLNGSEPLKWAFIVNDMVNHGQVRMFESINSKGEKDMQIFNPQKPEMLNDLRKWLCLDADFVFPQFIEQHGNDVLLPSV